MLGHGLVLLHWRGEKRVDSNFVLEVELAILDKYSM